MKIGIEPGSVCTTRKITGVGFPQLSATIEWRCDTVSEVILSRRRCQVRDIAKIWLWCDFVVGGMFAGHDECEGEIENGKMSFYGMSSEDAQLKHYGKKASHRASEGKKDI